MASSRIDVRGKQLAMRGGLVNAALASSIALALFSSHAHAVRVDYRADFEVERNDNVLLRPNNQISTTILRPGLGWLISQESSSWQVAMAGRGEYWHYQDRRFDSGAQGTLSGTVNWMALPDRLRFTLENDLSLQPVNTLIPDTPDNRQQINVLSVGPTLLFDIGRSMHGTAELRYINSRAEITEQFNSDRANAELRAIRDLNPTSSLSGNLQTQRVDYDNDLMVHDYNRTDAYLRYSKTLAALDLAIDAGTSRIAYQAGGRTRNEPLMRVQGTWRAGDRHQLTAHASRQFSDTANDALTGIVLSITQPPENVSVGTTVVNASLYEQRGLRLRYGYTGARTSVVFAPYYNRLRYVDNESLDQTARGALTEVRWQPRPRLTLGTHAAISRISYLDQDRDDELREYGVHADYELTRHLSTRVGVTRRERDLSTFGEDANQDLILFNLSYRSR